MELTIQQAFDKALEAQNLGNFEEAKLFYDAIIRSQPKHEAANHNLGLIAIDRNEKKEALFFLRTALEANPRKGQFWISYIGALIGDNQLEQARNMLEQGKNRGLAGEKVVLLEQQISSKMNHQNFKTKEEINDADNPKKLKQKMPKQEEVNCLIHHYQSRRYLEAEKIAKEITEKFPNHQLSWKILGAILKTSNRIKEALIANQKAVELAPNDPEAHNNLGIIFQDLGKHEDAKNSYINAIRIKPTLVEAHINLGVILQELGQLKDAESSYQKAIALKQDYPEVHYNLGIVRHKLGKLEEAISSYEKAVTLRPEYAEAHNNMGIVYEELNNFIAAESQYNKAIKLKSDFAEPYSNLGNLLKTLRRFDEAVENCIKAINYRSNYPEAFNNLGNVLRSLGRLAESENNFRNAVACNPNYAEAHNNLGVILQDLEKWPEAEMAHRKAVDLRPDYAEAYSNLGMVLKELERLEEAEICYRKAIGINPNLIEPYINLGVTLHGLNKLEEGMENCNKAIEFDRKNPKPYINLGNIFKDLGRFVEAEKSYRTGIALDCNFDKAHNNLAVVLQETGRLEESEKSYKQAITIKPDYKEALLNLSSSLLFANKLDYAEKYLYQLVAIESNSFGLKSSVTLAILSYLKKDFSHSRALLRKSSEILKMNDADLKNSQVYWHYINRLLNWHEQNISTNILQKDASKIYVIGESHALGSHGLLIEGSGKKIIFESQWILGCKQWHLGNIQPNKYKYKFNSIIQSLPQASEILLAIGEIDCRIDEGILNVHEKFPDKSILEIIESTIDGYLKFVKEETAPFFHKVTIQGIPCPNVKIDKIPAEKVAELIYLVKEFNITLRKTSKEMGFNFLDVHSLTDRGDGFSNKIWHLDDHHLSPNGILEAWRSHLLT